MAADQSGCAEVVDLHQPRTCDSCVFVMMGPRGSYCSEFGEIIQNEKVAQECEAYEP